MMTNTLITGPTNGIGRETALELARQGHKLFLLCRNQKLGEELCGDIDSIPNTISPTLLVADLGSPVEVRSAVERFLALNEPLNVLINNAGVVNTKRVLVDIEDSKHEQMFAVNHLGHFLLTQLLLPTLIETGKASGSPSRIVVVSSEAHALFSKGINWQDISYEKNFGSMKVYGQSKLANILMTRELAARLNPDEVQVNSLHPGAVNSNLGSNNTDHWYAGLLKTVLGLFFISPQKGAETTLYLATQNISTHGEYYCRCKTHRIKPWGLDEQAAKKLWDYSVAELKL